MDQSDDAKQPLAHRHGSLLRKLFSVPSTLVHAGLRSGRRERTRVPSVEQPLGWLGRRLRFSCGSGVDRAANDRCRGGRAFRVASGARGSHRLDI